MKNAMKLKAILKNMAKSKNISAQIVLQNFMLERLLERISVSSYRENFILKGGFLIAALVGLDTRATMDMDATVKGMPVNPDTIMKMFEEICEIRIDDDVAFAVKRIEGGRHRPPALREHCREPGELVHGEVDYSPGIRLPALNRGGERTREVSAPLSRGLDYPALHRREHARELPLYLPGRVGDERDLRGGGEL